MDAELEEFRKEFPDVKEALPDEVIKKVQYGMPLVEAYKDYLSKADLEMRLKELEQEVKVKKVNETNAEASTGKLGDQSETHDAELTEERIAKMTPAEREKYHPKIWAFLTGQK
jgi:hypothetical protein